MLKKIQQDFSYYSHEFKDNYRKGVHRLRTILASRAQAQAFVSNAGGVAVVLGYEPDKPDKNAQELYALLMASPYIDDAVQTFLGSIYEAGAESQDVMYSDSARCLEILHDPVMARAAGAGAVSAGKWIAALAGQSCNSYRDITAVAASATAMNAVAASATAMNAVAASATAMNAVAASDIAMTAVAASETAMAAVVSNATALNAVVTSQVALNAIAASETAMAAVIGNATALNVVATSQAAMNAVAASETAMTAVIANSTALNAVVTSHVAMNAVASSYVAVAAVYESAVAVEAVKANETAWATLTGASSAVMGKAAAKLAGLNPADYADMAAIASSSTAMAAVASSQTAMAAVASSQTAMAAIVASSTARTAITNSATAKNALASSPLKTTVTKGNGNGWENRTIRNGMGYLISCYNANSGGEAGSTWYKLDGAQNSQPAGTTNVGKFFTSSLAIYWWSSTSSVTYIPC
nr:MAG TPA: Tail fiber protein [Caudoviricetes sp.]